MEAKVRSLRYAWAVAAILLVLSMSTATAGKKEFTAKAGPDGVQRVEILGGTYFFDPNYIIVKVNVPVELKVKKEPGMVPHDIVLKAPEAGIDFAVELKDTPELIKFTPKKTGTYPFACKKKILFFESHAEKGMQGVLEVRN
jgi:plastocyanin domain-containing protein